MPPLPVEVDIDSELAPGKVIVGQGEWQEKGLCLLLADFVEGFKDPEHVRSPLSTERLDEGFGTHANMVPTHDVIEGGHADVVHAHASVRCATAAVAASRSQLEAGKTMTQDFIRWLSRGGRQTGNVEAQGHLARCLCASPGAMQGLQGA